MQQQFTNADQNSTVPPQTSTAEPGPLPESTLSAVGSEQELDRLAFYDILSKVRRTDLHEMAERCSKREPLAPEEVDVLLELVAKEQMNLWRERTVAACLLGMTPLTEEQRQKAGETLCTILHNRPPHPLSALKETLPRASLIALALTTPFPVLFTLLLFYIAPRPIYNHEYILYILLGVCGAIGVGNLAVTVTVMLMNGIGRRGRIQSAAAQVLGQLKLPESVGPLAKAMLSGSPVVYVPVAKALLAVLPSLTEKHYGTLGPETVPALCRILGVPGLFTRTDTPKRKASSTKKEEATISPAVEEQLQIALLEGLGKVGDGRSLPFVGRVMDKGWTEAMRHTAARLMPLLQERRRQEENYQMLLRGSSPPQSPAEEMLRPASGVVDTDPGEMLRPSDTPPKPDTR